MMMKMGWHTFSRIVGESCDTAWQKIFQGINEEASERPETITEHAKPFQRMRECNGLDRE